MMWASTPEAGAEPQNRAGVLRDVGLVEGDPHGVVSAAGSEPRQWLEIAMIGKWICATLGHCGAVAGLRSLCKGANKRRRIAAFVLPQD